MAKDNATKGPLRGNAVTNDAFDDADTFTDGVFGESAFDGDVFGPSPYADLARRAARGQRDQNETFDEIADHVDANAGLTPRHGEAPAAGASAGYEDEIVALLHQVGQRLLRSEQDRKELRLAMDDLAEKADSGARAFQSIQERIDKTESVLEKRQKRLEKIQSEQLERIEKAAAMADRIEEALAQQGRINRRLDKLAQDKARTIRKLERIESAVLETHEAINARALPPISAAPEPAQGKDGSFNNWLPQAPPANDADETAAPAKWWQNQTAIRTAAVTGMVLIGLVGGWAIGNVKIPGLNDGLNRFTPAAVGGAVSQTAAAPDTQGTLAQTTVTAAPAFGDLADYSPSAADVTPEKEEFARAIEQALSETYGTGTGLGTNETDETNATGEGFASETSPANETKPLTDETVLAAAPATNPLTRDDAALVASFEEDADALAAQLNEITPGTAAAIIDEVHDGAGAAAAKKATPARDDGFVEMTTAQFLASQRDARPLRDRIKADAGLPPVIREVESKAFEGIAEAQHDLAAIYTAGHGGVAIDYPRSANWFRESALNGIANARYNLGVLYHQGLGVPADINTAVNWYRAAAEMGHPEAQYNLGIAYIEGIGTRYNPDKAAFYFEKAANQGILEAAYNLGLIHENGLTGKSQPDEALYWYKQAADLGSPEAKVAMDQLAKTLGLMPGEVERMYSDVKNDKKAQAAPMPAATPVENAAKDLARNAARESARKASIAEAEAVAAAAIEPAAGGIEYIEALPLEPETTDEAVTASAPLPVATRTSQNQPAPTPPRRRGPDAEPAVIAQIQEQLIRLGLYPGPADGVNDTLTGDAIRAYQVSNNLPTDGRASQALLVHMMTSELDGGDE